MSEWIANFLTELKTINDEFGVFFSQAVYGKYFKTRDYIVELKEDIETNELIESEVKTDLNKPNTR